MRAARGLVVFAFACGAVPVRHAELQLDVSGFSLERDRDEVRIRTCIEGVGVSEETLGSGAVAFKGIPADLPVIALVDTLDAEERRSGRVEGPVLDAETPWAEAEWQACTGEDCAACTASGERAEAGEDDWLLAIRFLE